MTPDRRADPSDEPRYPGTPRWVKVFAVVALVILVGVVLVVGATALGLHTPGMHGPSH